MVRSAYPNLPETSADTDVTEFYQDITLQTLWRRLSSGDSNLNDIRPPSKEIDGIEEKLGKDEYEEFLQSGTASFQVEDDRTASGAHSWFSEYDDHHSEKTERKIAKAVKEDIGFGNEFTVQDAHDATPGAGTIQNVRKSLNTLVDGPLFEKDKQGNKNVYKMIRDWREG